MVKVIKLNAVKALVALLCIPAYASQNPGKSISRFSALFSTIKTCAEAFDTAQTLQKGLSFAGNCLTTAWHSTTTTLSYTPDALKSTYNSGRTLAGKGLSKAWRGASSALDYTTPARELVRQHPYFFALGTVGLCATTYLAYRHLKKPAKQTTTRQQPAIQEAREHHVTEAIPTPTANAGHKPEAAEATLEATNARQKEECSRATRAIQQDITKLQEAVDSYSEPISARKAQYNDQESRKTAIQTANGKYTQAYITACTEGHTFSQLNISIEALKDLQTKFDATYHEIIELLANTRIDNTEKIQRKITALQQEATETLQGITLSLQ